MALSTVTLSTVAWTCDARIGKVKGGRLRLLHCKFGADLDAV